MLESYAAYNADLSIRMKSSSGGVYSLIAENVLKCNGIIYGVAMTEDCYSAQFIRVTDKDALGQLRGSKYFQAKIGDTFIRIKNDLESGKIVLFTGTGCQVNGLKSFLGKEYKNLVCVDVICHGVPSPKLWKEYVAFQEKKYGKLQSVNFRCKDEGWKNFGMKENAVYIPKSKDPFLQMFLGDFCLRPSCYECHAKKMKLSDISIADLWGIEHLAPELDDAKGCSWVIVRSQQGKRILEQIKNNLVIREIDYTCALRYNSPESKSVKRSDERDCFFEHLNSKPFLWIIRKYGRDPFHTRFKRKLKRVVLRIVRGGVRRHRTALEYGVLYQYKDQYKERTQK